MANRIGEFTLVFDPGNDSEVLDPEIVVEIVRLLRICVRYSGEQPVDGLTLYFAASPERGSIRFPMFAGVVAAAGAALGHAANLSQITGVDVGDALVALKIISAPREAASNPAFHRNTAVDLAAGEDYAGRALELMDRAQATNFKSIRIETPDGLKVELTRSEPPPTDPTQAERDLAAARADLANIQRELRKLGEEDGKLHDAVRAALTERRVGVAHSIRGYAVISYMEARSNKQPSDGQP